MKLEDIIALAKQGYKPADIKELVSLADDNKQDDAQPTNQGEDTHSEDDQKNHATNENKPTEGEAVSGGNAVDYKALYEESQKQLELAQKANIKKDVSDSENNVTDADTVADFVKSFM